MDYKSGLSGCLGMCIVHENPSFVERDNNREYFVPIYLWHWLAWLSAGPEPVNHSLSASSGSLCSQQDDYRV